jgi:hypothetical protein
MQKALGKENVLAEQPVMGSEDSSLFALEDPKPAISMFCSGALDPAKWTDAQEKGSRIPSMHSSEFALLPDPAHRSEGDVRRCHGPAEKIAISALR